MPQHRPATSNSEWPSRRKSSLLPNATAVAAHARRRVKEAEAQLKQEKAKQKRAAASEGQGQAPRCRHRNCRGIAGPGPAGKEGQALCPGPLPWHATQPR